MAHDQTKEVPTNRRRLRGVAAGFTTFFMDRNNDIGGRWGAGVLLALAQSLNRRDMTISIIGTDLGEAPQAPQTVKEGYRRKLLDIAKKHQVAASCMSHAIMTLDFAAQFPAGPARYGIVFRYPREVATVGESFSCSLTIADDRGKTYKHVEYGRVFATMATDFTTRF